MIANEFGEAANVPIHASALFAAGLVLFVLTLIVNIIARWFVAARHARLARGAGGGAAAGDGCDGRPRSPPASGSPMSVDHAPRGQRPPPRTDKVMRGLLLVGTVIALVPLVLIIYYLLYKGLSTWSRSFFTTDPNGNFFGNPGGIRSAIVGTLEIVALATPDLGPDRDRRRPVPDRVRQANRGSPTWCATSST